MQAQTFASYIPAFSPPMYKGTRPSPRYLSPSRSPPPSSREKAPWSLSHCPTLQVDTELRLLPVPPSLPWPSDLHSHFCGRSLWIQLWPCLHSFFMQQAGELLECQQFSGPLGLHSTWLPSPWKEPMSSWRPEVPLNLPDTTHSHPFTLSFNHPVLLAFP